MRIVKEIVRPHYKASIFHWNNKYLLKLETPTLEQTFKIPEFDVTGDADVANLLTEGFVAKALARFAQMDADLAEEMAKI